MAKNDNPHALRFLESMEKRGEKETAENFSVEHPLSKSADFNKKYASAEIFMRSLMYRISIWEKRDRC